MSRDIPPASASFRHRQPSFLYHVRLFLPSHTGTAGAGISLCGPAGHSFSSSRRSGHFQQSVGRCWTDGSVYIYPVRRPALPVPVHGGLTLCGIVSGPGSSPAWLLSSVSLIFDTGYHVFGRKDFHTKKKPFFFGAVKKKILLTLFMRLSSPTQASGFSPQMYNN